MTSGLAAAPHSTDGITEAHRGTWSRLARLHTASIALPAGCSAVDCSDHDDHLFGAAS